MNKHYTIWRAILIAATVIGLAGIVGEMVWSADKGKFNAADVITVAASAKITIQGAAESALASVAGQVIEAKLEKRADKTVWMVEILTAKESIMTVYVDAVSGSMMMTEEKVPQKNPVQGQTS